jgi:hypothetical protein
MRKYFLTKINRRKKRHLITKLEENYHKALQGIN